MRINYGEIRLLVNHGHCANLTQSAIPIGRLLRSRILTGVTLFWVSHFQIVSGQYIVPAMPSLSRKTPAVYPIRINRYLAHEDIATRRGADNLITQGKVLINGRAAKLGDQVNEGDKVEMRGKPAPKKYVYFAYNKPRGIITHSPQFGEKDIKQSVAHARSLRNVFPVGRLDKNSSGLIILTNDGRVTDHILNPDYAHEKEYRVETNEPLREGFKKAMEGGVNIDGYVTKSCTVRKTGPKRFTIVLTEGKKHQIRRMVAALHNSVVALERTRILNIRLGTLAPGAWRPIESEELETFFFQLG